MLNEAIQILRDLVEEQLPDWHSDCDCYSVSEMKAVEQKIDDFLEREVSSQSAVQADTHKCPICGKFWDISQGDCECGAYVSTA